MPLLCGIDEVGRGALAGPLFAVAAMFQVEDLEHYDRKFSPINGVDDSKKFTTHAKRTEVFHRILRSPDIVDFGIGYVSAEEIDRVGIDEANRLAFYRAWTLLKTPPNFILVDGDNPAPAWNYSLQRNKPKADGLWWPVGAASILAKVIRDNLMVEYGLDYPQYRWAENAGYGTSAHNSAIKHFGPSPLHRRKFIQKILGG